METLILTSLGHEELNLLIKQAVQDALNEISGHLKDHTPAILDIKQAAGFLHLKVTTLYEKTSRKLIPHFKRGNKLYFYKEQLETWISEGKVKTHQETESEAVSYTTSRHHFKKA